MGSEQALDAINREVRGMSDSEKARFYALLLDEIRKALL